MKKLIVALLSCVGIFGATTTHAVTVHKPTVSITSPTSGKTTTNSTYIVEGKTGTIDEVTNVFFILNKGTNAPASSTNNWKSWYAVANLNVGTNLISAFAIGTNGLSSSTDTVKLIYAVYLPLTVETNGKGIITPNENGKGLEIGKKYTLTAKGHDGFSFVDWTGGIGFPTTILTNKASLAFAMQTNLVLEANFDDTEKPYLSITNVKTGMGTTNIDFTFMGRATDNVAVASVNFSTNGSPFAPATLNGNTWSAPVGLSPGSNIFAVYAEDTSGNISATDKVLILQQPFVTTFLITSNNVSYPQGQLSFDGTNYLVAYECYSNSGSGARAQFVSSSGSLVGAPLSLNPNAQNTPPYLDFDGANYLVAWADTSDEAAGVPLRGTFVNPNGMAGRVITLSQSTTVDTFSTIVYGGGVYFVMWADNRTLPTTTNSVYGALISPSGSLVSGDFLIGTNATEDETAGISAAFDRTNFLAVWSLIDSDTSIQGRLINTAGGFASAPFVIFTNSASAGLSLVSVTFDGTKYLVLFNTGVNSSDAGAYHIQGRFVTTAGTVLTNRITLTTDNGPQIAPSADFDGVHYLVSWNQGYNPFTADKTATIYGRYFNSEGNATNAEFPIFTTQVGAKIPFWAPVIWDGSKYVMAAGFAHLITSSEATNIAIYGAFVSP